MELDDIKQAWGKVETPQKTRDKLNLMLYENKHPVLKEIRRQLTIEIAGWCIFLLCYYTMFDGHLKPVWINAVLVVTMLMALLHNITGYYVLKFPISGNNLKTSLQNYLAKIKLFAALSIASRLVLISSLLLYFMYGIEWNTRKYILIAIILLIVLLQLTWLFKLWTKRWKMLKNSLATLVD